MIEILIWHWADCLGAIFVKHFEPHLTRKHTCVQMGDGFIILITKRAQWQTSASKMISSPALVRYRHPGEDFHLHQCPALPVLLPQRVVNHSFKERKVGRFCRIPAFRCPVPLQPFLVSGEAHASSHTQHFALQTVHYREIRTVGASKITTFQLVSLFARL